jgi:ubiquinol-cytochrome c reductase cytochrome c1 subunit
MSKLVNLKSNFYKALTIAVLALTSFGANSAGDAKHPMDIKWPFEGSAGIFDNASAQRGFQVYKEVCAACHSLKRIAFRNLTEIGFSPEEVKAIAAQYQVEDGPDDFGDMFMRDGRPSDRVPAPYPNEKAAAAANGGAYPTDLSLIVKARPNGADYLYSLLVGYEPAPEDKKLPAGKYYNPYFSGGAISMPAPLSEGLVTYEDGTEATVEQMAKDVTVFLQWAAEPEMEHRKQMGIKVLLFLLVFTILFYVAKNRIWSRIGQ